MPLFSFLLSSRHRGQSEPPCHGYEQLIELIGKLQPLMHNHQQQRDDIAVGDTHSEEVSIRLNPIREPLMRVGKKTTRRRREDATVDYGG